MVVPTLCLEDKGLVFQSRLCAICLVALKRKGKKKEKKTQQKTLFHLALPGGESQHCTAGNCACFASPHASFLENYESILHCSALTSWA